MKCKNIDENIDKPEECEWCDTETDNLTRYVDQCGGINITWLCKYCGVDKEVGRNTMINTIAAMFNILEESLKGKNITS